VQLKGGNHVDQESGKTTRHKESQQFYSSESMTDEQKVLDEQKCCFSQPTAFMQHSLAVVLLQHYDSKIGLLSVLFLNGQRLKTLKQSPSRKV